MGLFDSVFGFTKDSLGEIASHPWQAAGAALGVPGYDPFFGGLFNNKPGGALISPTGNFTSSAWQDMYNRNPGDAGALNTFSGINSVADKVAPAVAGYFAGPALSAAASGSGAAAGSGTGLASGATTGAGMGAASSAAPEMGLLGTGGMYGTAAAANGAAPAVSSMGGLLGTGGMYGSAPVDMSSFGGSGVFGGSAANGIGAAPSGAPVFSDGGSFLTNGTGGMDWSSIAQQAGKMAMNNQQQQQQRQQMGFTPSRPPALGNPAVRNAPIGPQMPYAQFNGSQPSAVPSFMQFRSAYA
jgi:hypothetical protein